MRLWAWSSISGSNSHWCFPKSGVFQIYHYSIPKNLWNLKSLKKVTIPFSYSFFFFFFWFTWWQFDMLFLLHKSSLKIFVAARSCLEMKIPCWFRVIVFCYNWFCFKSSCVHIVSHIVEKIYFLQKRFLLPRMKVHSLYERS